MADCTKCKYKLNKLHIVAGCYIYGCEIRGTVPFWTNSDNTLINIECKYYRAPGANDLEGQLLFNFEEE